jgi:hypothetical protein
VSEAASCYLFVNAQLVFAYDDFGIFWCLLGVKI